MSNSYLSFKLGHEYFAAHVSKVLHILELPPITKVPKSHDYMSGVINLRGSVLPVVDVRKKFNISNTGEGGDSCIVVMDITMDDENVEVGALVDAVYEVFEISDEQILPPPSIGNKYKSEMILGVVEYNELFVMLLDIDKVLSLEHTISFVNI